MHLYLVALLRAALALNWQGNIDLKIGGQDANCRRGEKRKCEKNALHFLFRIAVSVFKERFGETK